MLKCMGLGMGKREDEWSPSDATIPRIAGLEFKAGYGAPSGIRAFSDPATLVGQRYRLPLVFSATGLLN